MMWNLCLGFSVFSLVVFIFLAILNHEYVNVKNKRRLIKNNNDVVGDDGNDMIRPILQRRPTLMAAWLIVGVFVSAFLLILPLCRELILSVDSDGGWFVSVFHAIRSSFQIFSLDVDYLDFYKGAGIAIYRGFAAILYVLAPIFLISFVVTLFRNLFANVRIAFTTRRPIYAFSELNEKSLTLAESCLIHYWGKNAGKENDSGEDKSKTDKDDEKDRRKPLIIFTDVYEQQEEESAELVSNARSIGALCIRSDILSLTMRRFRLKKKRVYFFILGSGEAENIGQAVDLIENYKKCPGVSLYVLTESEESKLLISSAMDLNMDMYVYLINSAQALVYNYLYDTDSQKKDLFYKVQQIENRVSKTKEETAFTIVLVGLGGHGTELLRALVWYLQLPYLYPEIHVFERDLSAEQKFASQCPELIGMNHKRVEGESRYDIIFHHTEDGRGLDAETIDFDREILNLPEVDAAFVALGKDAENIRIAVKLRRLLEQSYPLIDKNRQPVIRAIVFNTDKTKIAKKYGIHDLNVDQERYEIGLIGDIRAEWSYEVIVADELRQDAYDSHMQWYWENCKNGGEEDEEKEPGNKFYIYEYNRKSSMGSVIRSKVRRALPMPGLDPGRMEPLTEEEKQDIRKMEHIGWNAYMRGEGYQYGPERDDMLKFHPLLLPHGALPESERAKDDDYVKKIESEKKKKEEEQMSSDKQSSGCANIQEKTLEERSEAWKEGLTEEEILEVDDPGFDKYHKDEIEKGILNGLDAKEVISYAKEYRWTDEIKAQIIEQRKEGKYPLYARPEEENEDLIDGGEEPAFENPDYYKPICAYTEMELERKRLTEEND